ncbi:hypothetical protein [Georgenia thermotolerans]|uniref:Uncharacterized protein n=1 Tax=Georgenia thermotolerans TaxID=527326 RepID=A0A7J5UIH3_9MICO|nr:hypothetical protein [Georgenia thermotolerans]KAE8762175.1 hypothetical protein GB883_20735 [Georgenia thermotolerans]
MTDTANSPAVTSTNRWPVRVAGTFIALGGLVIAVLRFLSARGWTVIVGPVPHFALEFLAWGIVGTGTCGLTAVAARKLYAQSDRLARLTAIFLTLVAIVGGILAALVIFGSITWVALEGVTRLHTPGTDRHWAVEATSGLGDTSYTFYVATNPFLFREAGQSLSGEMYNPFGDGHYRVQTDPDGHLTLRYPTLRGGPYDATLQLER